MSRNAEFNRRDHKSEQPDGHVPAVEAQGLSVLLVEHWGAEAPELPALLRNAGYIVQVTNQDLVNRSQDDLSQPDVVVIAGDELDESQRQAARFRVPYRRSEKRPLLISVGKSNHWQTPPVCGEGFDLYLDTPVDRELLFHVLDRFRTLLLGTPISAARSIGQSPSHAP